MKITILNSNGGDRFDKDSTECTKETKKRKTKGVVFSTKTKDTEVKIKTFKGGNVAITSILKKLKGSITKEKGKTIELIPIGSYKSDNGSYNTSDIKMKLEKGLEKSKYKSKDYTNYQSSGENSSNSNIPIFFTPGSNIFT